jgi:O-antigen/teichoic acid export membrane protein
MSLRGQVMRGGAYLAVRQGLGMVISLVGVLLLTRTIGPGAYGLYTAVLGIFTYVLNLSQWGMGVYLVRREGEVQEEEYHQAFTILLCTGTGALLATLAATPLIEKWMQSDGLGGIVTAMAVALPINLMTLVPLAKLERSLDYRKVALIELGGQISYYAVALPLAFKGAGAWAPVVGWWVQQVVAAGSTYMAGQYRPRFNWNRALIRQMVNYGIGYSGSMWIWQLRSLVNPLVVGRFLGLETVGYIALAIRIVDMLSFVKSATWRLAIAGLARLQSDRARLCKAITEGMQLQVLALGPLLVGFGLLAPLVMPRLFGPKWSPALSVYPFIAAGALANALFNLHSSALYVLRRNWEVATFHLLHILLFAGSALLLVPTLGMMGYGCAELVALLSYVVIHGMVQRFAGSPSYHLVLAWWVLLVLPLFWSYLGIWAVLSLAVIAVWPGTIPQIRQYVARLRDVRSA